MHRCCPDRLPASFVAVALAGAVGATVLAHAPAPVATTARAADDAAVLMGMAGTWTGELEYRDYQTDERVTLPATRRAELSGLGPFLHQELTFSDPGHEVRSHQTIAIESDGRVSLIMMMPDGVQRETYEIREAEVTDAMSAWRVVLQRVGMDDRRPADIRLTHTMRGDRLTARKDVRFHDEGDWVFRNEARFDRQKTDAQKLVGVWQVDLRPTPDAPPHLVEMRVDSVEDGRVTGSFYGAPIRHGSVNVGWGDVQFAFVTDDASGVYHTSGVVQGDRITGRTHAQGRGFLSGWYARRSDRP